MNLKAAFDGFMRGGQITSEERRSDLCLQCDGFGYIGHLMKKSGDSLEPDYNHPVTCPRCQGFGYIKFIHYTRDDGATFYVPEDETEVARHE